MHGPLLLLLLQPEKNFGESSHLKLFASKRMPEFKQPANNASDGEVLSWFRGQAAEHGGSDATDTEVLGWFREQAAANGSNKLILE